MAKETPIKHYRLKRPFWDNKVMQPKGAVLPFPEGKQPSTAVLVTEAEIEVMSAAEKAVSVTVGLPEGFYDEVVAEVTERVIEALEVAAAKAAVEAEALEKAEADAKAKAEAEAATKASAEGGSTPADPKAKK